MTADPSFGPVGERVAARQAIAASVLAWTSEPAADGAAAVIHRNLVGLLPRCGEPGTLAVPLAPDGVEATADRLAGRLLDDMADVLAREAV